MYTHREKHLQIILTPTFVQFPFVIPKTFPKLSTSIYDALRKQLVALPPSFRCVKRNYFASLILIVQQFSIWRSIRKKKRVESRLCFILFSYFFRTPAPKLFLKHVSIFEINYGVEDHFLTRSELKL